MYSHFSPPLLNWLVQKPFKRLHVWVSAVATVGRAPLATACAPHLGLLRILFWNIA